MKKIIIISLAFALMLTASCKQAADNETGPLKVGALTLKDTTCVAKFHYPATIHGIQDIAIFPQVSGRITKVRVKGGQFVKAGQVLFDIDDVPYRAAYDQALAAVEVSKAQVATAKITLQSKQNLFDKEIISEYQLELAKNELATAIAVLGQSEAALKNAKNQLSFTNVRTDISGFVGALPYKVGSLVGTNITEPMTTISDNSQIYAEFSIQENIYLMIAEQLKENDFSDTTKGPTLTLITNNGAEYPEKGIIYSVNGMISQTTGALPIKAIFPNPDKILLSGGSCQVVFSMEMPNSILVPRASMKEIQDKLFVYVIKNGTLNQIPVNAERFDNNYWMILPNPDGQMPLKSGDVITTTTNRLQNGMQVEIM